MTRLIATFFFSGYLKPFSGTWGSAAALVAAFALYLLGGWLLVALLTPVAFGLGLWATARETRGKDNHDPSEIVIDEVAGQWLALLPVLIGATWVHAGNGWVFSNQGGGWEYPVFLIVASVVQALLGSGAYAVKSPALFGERAAA